MNLNQWTNGGAWNFFGHFTMSPASNHRVEVTDSTHGIVVADAVRFVSATTSGTGLMYVHADHLGTPQKMTDGTQTLVWDAVYEPFGETHSITGTASNNQRFPGQYADAESGFSYNYFRDYDPTTGRYVQSDPIGLQGGLNTYSYVKGNPLSFIDPKGENPIITLCRAFPRLCAATGEAAKKVFDKLKSKTKKTNAKPTCSLSRADKPNSPLNPGCKCWRCTYQCKGKGIVGGGMNIVRFQIGACIPMKGPGFVPGFINSSSCDAAESTGSTTNPIEGAGTGNVP